MPRKQTPKGDTPEAEVPTGVTPEGPAITYIGDGAEDVKFTINPNAASYTVYADGAVVECM